MDSCSVKIRVKAKIIEVEGPRGKLTGNFKHLNLDITDEETGAKKLKVDAWFGSRKTTAAIRIALSHIGNLITGVTKGYRYKMRFVYAHFPINASITSLHSDQSKVHPRRSPLCPWLHSKRRWSSRALLLVYISSSLSSKSLFSDAYLMKALQLPWHHPKYMYDL